MNHSKLPVPILNRSPYLSKTVKDPILSILVSICLLCGSGMMQACCQADPSFPQAATSTTFFLPLLDAYGQHPTKAGAEGWSGISRLDAFVFNDDELMELDSYCCITGPKTPYITINSGSGDKYIVMLANYRTENLDAGDFWSYEALENIRSRLEEEDPARPVMSGEGHFRAGENGYVTIQMVPLLSNICVDFVRCNFAGKNYRSRTLENASVYLTNISGSAEVLRHDGFRISELENCGRLDMSYLSSMKHPEMIYSPVTPGQWTPVNLYCYPNDDADGVLGSPHTRLVLQGDIDDATYYYPVEINQDGFGYSSGKRGIGRNIKYSFSFNITSKGSTDPDIPIMPDGIVETGWIKLYPGNYVTGTNGEKVHIWCETLPEDARIDICKEDLDFDVERGIYDYTYDADGHGVTLTLKENGTGMFTIDAGPPINDGFLVIVVVNP